MPAESLPSFLLRFLKVGGWWGETCCLSICKEGTQEQSRPGSEEWAGKLVCIFRTWNKEEDRTFKSSVLHIERFYK